MCEVPLPTGGDEDDDASSPDANPAQPSRSRAQPLILAFVGFYYFLMLLIGLLLVYVAFRGVGQD